MNSIMSVGSSMLSMIGRDPGTIPELSFGFREQHFLVGQMLCELKNSFDTKWVIFISIIFVLWPRNCPELTASISWISKY